MRLVSLLGLTALLSPAQSFDVASLKPVQLDGGATYNANLGTARHGQVTLINCTLSDCLRYAFTITSDAQLAGPDWIRNKDVRFDIQAKAPPETPDDQILVMLQNLLTERFKLVLHREPRELSYLALTVAKNGCKLQPAHDGSPPAGKPQIPGRIISNRMFMSTLATLLSRFLRQTVLDRSGLQGAYDVNLTWTPERVAESPDSTPGPTIYTAIQEQLGLKLESRKGPVEVIVIDQAQKIPLEN